MVAASKNVIFKCVSKRSNKVAWVLANQALGTSGDNVWLDDAPLCIRSLVEDE